MVTKHLRKAYTSFATHVLDIPPRLLAFLLFLLLLAYPVTKPGFTILLILTFASVGAIYMASWDLMIRCGQFSLGHALFFGIGAYSTALLSKTGLFYSLPIWATIPLSTLTGVAVAMLVGFPCSRVKGPYFALVTMSLSLIALAGVYYFKDVTGGERPVSGLPKLFPFLSYTDQFIAQYYFALLLLLVSGIILYKVANSRTTGVAFVSILDDEVASKACGINTTKYKLLAFSISALFATLAGAAHAHVLISADTGTLWFITSFLPVIVTIFAGIGTIYGPIAGAFILAILNEPGGVLEAIFHWAASQNLISGKVLELGYAWHWIFFVTIIIILVIKWPRGIARFTTDKLADLAKEREIEERGPRIWKKYIKEKK